jgi:Flp pilus assembly protein TadD
MAGGGPRPAGQEDVRIDRAVAMLEDGRPAEASRLLAALATEHPRDDRIATSLGRAWFRLERYGEAITWFSRYEDLECLTA